MRIGHPHHVANDSVEHRTLRERGLASPVNRVRAQAELLKCIGLLAYRERARDVPRHQAQQLVHRVLPLFVACHRHRVGVRCNDGLENAVVAYRDVQRFDISRGRAIGHEIKPEYHRVYSALSTQPFVVQLNIDPVAQKVADRVHRVPRSGREHFDLVPPLFEGLLVCLARRVEQIFESNAEQAFPEGIARIPPGQRGEVLWTKFDRILGVAQNVERPQNHPALFRRSGWCASPERQGHDRECHNCDSRHRGGVEELKGEPCGHDLECRFVPSRRSTLVELSDLYYTTRPREQVEIPQQT
eukprot:m.234710 g.234710  ORF g.234710 m.234710 type:complete len:300 (-) comp26133_c0_seq3:346-1245(-)